MTYANSASGTFEEWRVTGDPGHGYPLYDFVFSPLSNRHLGESETAARAFVEQIREHGDWAGGPYLHRRTVAITDWEEMP